jgi:hypothetical protein
LEALTFEDDALSLGKVRAETRAARLSATGGVPKMVTRDHRLTLDSVFSTKLVWPRIMRLHYIIIIALRVRMIPTGRSCVDCPINMELGLMPISMSL